MHALITGASSGIGEAIAKVLSEAGYDVTLVARRQSELERVIRDLSGPTRKLAIACDLADTEELAKLQGRAEAAQGPIDVLINNAGLGMVAHTHEVDLEEADRLMRVNLLAPLLLIRLLLPKMVARRSGTIVNIASVSALAPTPYSFYYNASKGGLSAASEALWAEAKRHGVHVLTVYPGPIKTALLEHAMSKMPKDTPRTLDGTPLELAQRILRAMRSKRQRLVYPRAFAATRMAPNVARWAIDRFFPEIE